MKSAIALQSLFRYIYLIYNLSASLVSMIHIDLVDALNPMQFTLLEFDLLKGVFCAWHERRWRDERKCDIFHCIKLFHTINWEFSAMSKLFKWIIIRFPVIHSFHFVLQFVSNICFFLPYLVLPSHSFSHNWNILIAEE